MSKIKKHVILASLCFVGWLFFLLIGMPSNYYVDWTYAEKILLLFITCFAFLPFLSIAVLVAIGSEFKKNSLLLAFYVSIEILLLDILYCGLYQSLGLTFFRTHWVQTIGYLAPWVEIPYVGYLMDKWSKA